ncbi:MerR family transcriptional regulator [Streptomyces ambofaciens]|uniref:MerR family transcriptional regulator n=1 Tax=Streptomyces ambofaciens TaxID=1889 RepID=A0ABN4P4J2_STRAM|nr:MerR family transcriptional regulator [Streptomyces ambofaciens]
MRIGELADAVGVTTRTVRHYHHQGLLPEPERLANGYRTYTLRHVVVLARVRRLTELGLGPAEVRDVLADEAGKDLAEVLAELDADLERQEAAIRERRVRLRATHETAGGELNLAVGLQTSVTVELTEPVVHVGFLGRRREVRVVRCHADDPAALVRAVDQAREGYAVP